MSVPDSPSGNRFRWWKRIRQFLYQYGELDDQIAWVIIVLILIAAATHTALAKEFSVLRELIGGE